MMICLPPSIIRARLGRELLRHRHGRLGLHPTRRDTHHADPLWRHFLRQCLAVCRQCRFRCRIRGGRLRERQDALDRRHMDDHTGALREHRRQRAVETNGQHQILVQRLRPLARRPAPGTRRARWESPSTLTRMSMPPKLVQHRLPRRQHSVPSAVERGRRKREMSTPSDSCLSRRGSRRGGHDLRAGKEGSPPPRPRRPWCPPVTSVRLPASCRSKVMALSPGVAFIVSDRWVVAPGSSRPRSLRSASGGRSTEQRSARRRHPCTGFGALSRPVKERIKQRPVIAPGCRRGG